MIRDMRRLHPRGAASRGICVDAEGATLGPDCSLVLRTSHGYRVIDREEASALQKCLSDASRDQDWLFRQCQRIADALDKGEMALAQIFGLHIPIAELDSRQLRRIALAKANFNPDEPRVPKGDPHGGEWTTGGGANSADASGPTNLLADLSDGGSDGPERLPGAELLGSGTRFPLRRPRRRHWTALIFPVMALENKTRGHLPSQWKTMRFTRFILLKICCLFSERAASVASPAHWRGLLSGLVSPEQLISILIMWWRHAPYGLIQRAKFYSVLASLWTTLRMAPFCPKLSTNTFTQTRIMMR